MTLVDTHCHLYEPPLLPQLPAVLERAAAAGVGRIVVPAYDRASWPLVEDLAARHPDRIRAALGIHPWVEATAADLADLGDRLRGCGAVAIGEVGLDGKVPRPSPAAQLDTLHRQLALARDLDLPAILHCRGAFDELLALLARFTPGLRGVVHAFSRPPELAARFLRLGLYLGIGGAVTRPRASVRRTVADAPLARLVLETDAPSIGLEGVEPAAVEPCHVRDVAAAVAAVRGQDERTVAEATSRNAAALFGL
jgi:TatD DNase family protein